MPFTVVKSPPTYTRDPSGEAATTRACAFNVGANVVSRFPVVMSYASRFGRGVFPTPTAAPAGRALVKLPPANTRLPTTDCDQTTPSI